MPISEPSASGTWKPILLSEYEIGRAVSAIEAVSRCDKPISEVGGIEAQQPDLETDLIGCLRLVRGADDVRYWIKPSGSRLRFGFYREPWALDALEFLDNADLDESNRAWISGLLFGYRPKAIQDFIARQASACEPLRASA